MRMMTSGEQPSKDELYGNSLNADEHTVPVVVDGYCGGGAG